MKFQNPAQIFNSYEQFDKSYPKCKLPFNIKDKLRTSYDRSKHTRNHKPKWSKIQKKENDPEKTKEKKTRMRVSEKLTAGDQRIR